MKTEEEVYMTMDEAEDVFMAWQAGIETDKSKIAHALLLLKKRDLKEMEWE